MMQAEKLERKKLNVTDFLSSPDMEEQFRKTFGDRKVNDFALDNSSHDIYKQEKKKGNSRQEIIIDSKPKPKKTRNQSKSRQNKPEIEFNKEPKKE